MKVRWKNRVEFELGRAATLRQGGKERTIQAQRPLFDIPADVSYFNCAGLAPLLHSARAAGEAALARRGQPWLIDNAQWFEAPDERRSLFARLLGVDPDGVALVPAASYGMAVAARNLAARSGQRLLVLAGDFPSGVNTWRAFARKHGAEILTVNREPGQNWTDAVLEALDDRVAIASVPSAHWTDGALLDLARVGARARACGARLVVDATQSLGAVQLDLAAARPDYLIAAGYKWLLGPYGLSYLYVAEEHRDGEPLEENWISRAGSDDFAGLADYRDDYLPGARRFDVGERAEFELTPMANAALRQLIDWGVDNIEAALSGITARIEDAARELGIAISSDGARGPHMIGLLLPPERCAAAPDALRRAGVHVALRGTALRVSPHLHITGDDIGRLTGALRSLVG